MARPSIYGDERRFRTALGRYIRRGEELLDQAEGVQTRIDAVAGHDLAEFYAIDIQDDWEKTSEDGSVTLAAEWGDICRARWARGFLS